MHKCMDYKNIGFDWNNARAFWVTAETGSLSAAARALGQTQPTLGRQVAALESQLSVVLFERIGRGLTLTPTGRDLLEHLRAMGNAAAQFSMVAAGQSQSLEGTVRISASEVDAAFRLPALIAKLRKLEPRISLDIVATNSESDLQNREADIAIRNYQPKQPNLITRRVGTIQGRLYATPKYLQTLDDALNPSGISEASFIGFDRTDGLIRALSFFDIHITQANIPIISSSHLNQWAMVREGLGIGVMAEDLAAPETAVMMVLPDRPALPVPVWLVSHSELHTSRRVRLVFDFLADELAKALR